MDHSMTSEEAHDRYLDFHTAWSVLSDLAAARPALAILRDDAKRATNAAWDLYRSTLS